MITQKELMEQVSYDPLTGIFKRLISNVGHVKIGDILQSPHGDGYITGRVLNKSYRLHRLAWFYMTGEWPEDGIDHINRIKDDNRWENLRECNQSQNMANSILLKRNTSGYKGVSWYKAGKVWEAYIMFNSKRIHLGRFTNKHKAALAYNTKALEVFGQFALLNEVSL